MDNRKAIYFDMDGTIADLYGVEGWLDMLIAESSKPYEQARTLVNASSLARILNRLQRNGWVIGVVSWTSKCGTMEYNKRVATAKMEWLNKHLKSVEWNEIHIVEYGTPKSTVVKYKNGILFDDEIGNRNEWKGNAFDVDKIVEILKELR